MEKIVDAKGFACPQPVLMAKDALKGMTEGELKLSLIHISEPTRH